jgi:paraquat-inducible protein A
MSTRKLLTERSDTILSGIVQLWSSGNGDVAVIVFVASFIVPLTKLIVLALLVVTTQRHSTWAQRERTQLYRAIEFVGYWSMLDVFVVGLLAALVQLQTVAEVHPLPGAAAFGAVVVLTMLASMSFDPRLIWDPQDAERAPHG